jgi:hypothetical protein
MARVVKRLVKMYSDMRARIKNSIDGGRSQEVANRTLSKATGDFVRLRHAIMVLLNECQGKVSH